MSNYGWNVDFGPGPPHPPLPPPPAPAAAPATLAAEAPSSGEYQWKTSSGGEVPHDAVVAGVDKGGETIYVGRAFHEGDLLPAKIVPSHGCAYVAYAGGEHRRDSYEVLCADQVDVSWVAESDGNVPRAAVPIGSTKDDETLYIGRVLHDGTLTPGKIHGSHKCCYIPYGGEELSFPNYEALVIREYQWKTSSGGEVPHDAVVAGVDKGGETIYVGRAFHEGDLIPAKIVPSHGCAYVAYAGGEHRKDAYEVLCADQVDVSWVAESDGNVPRAAVPIGSTKDDETLYIGRVLHDGTLTPGKIHKSHKCCYIPYGGEELSFPNYEALVIRG